MTSAQRGFAVARVEDNLASVGLLRGQPIIELGSLSRVMFFMANTRAAGVVGILACADKAI